MDLYDNTDLIYNEYIKNNFISKVKIIDKIEELTNMLFVGNADSFDNRRRKYAINILLELLEE